MYGLGIQLVLHPFIMGFIPPFASKERLALSTSIVLIPHLRYIGIPSCVLVLSPLPEEQDRDPTPIPAFAAVLSPGELVGVYVDCVGPSFPVLDGSVIPIFLATEVA
jgi:hypothetical protein